MMAKIFPMVKDAPDISFIPIITATPRMEIIVPIQKIFVGFSFMNNNAPIPTQTGARLANSVDIEAFESRKKDSNLRTTRNSAKRNENCKKRSCSNYYPRNDN